MTVSHLYQNLRIAKGVRSLNRLLKVLIIAINAQSHSVDATCPPPPCWGARDHLCPYGRKLIGSLVPVHSRIVRSNTYASLHSSLKLVAFLLNYFTCFPIHAMIVLTDVVCYDWFMVLIGRSSVGGSCEISIWDLFCFLFVFSDPGSQLSSPFIRRWMNFWMILRMFLIYKLGRMLKMKEKLENIGFGGCWKLKLMKWIIRRKINTRDSNKECLWSH